MNKGRPTKVQGPRSLRTYERSSTKPRPRRVIFRERINNGKILEEKKDRGREKGDNVLLKDKKKERKLKHGILDPNNRGPQTTEKFTQEDE